MNYEININELCKQISLGRTKGTIIWTRESRQHFITNRYWMVRFQELPNPVLAALFGVFYKIPEEGCTFNSAFGQVESEPKFVTFKNIFQPDLQHSVGVVTEYLRELEKKNTCRIIKFTSRYALVNSEFLKLVSPGYPIEVMSTDSPTAPIYFAKGDVLVLPYRIAEGKLAIEDLLGAELG